MIRLENELVAVAVLPELGAKIWSLIYKPMGTNWIWHNPTVPLKALTAGASYDDNWAGGWEELFPNDAPGEFLGRNLPDHGEWWNSAWLFMTFGPWRGLRTVVLDEAWRE